MQELGLRSKLSKKFKVTTNSKHKYLIVSNVLNRKVSVTEPSKVWVSDSTYIKLKDGFICLTTVLGGYDQKIIGWSLSNGMSVAETSLAALRIAIKNRCVEKELVFNFDRGVQYASKKFTNRIDFYKTIIRSMSRKGNCWDNAVAEAFFKTLKTEQTYGNKLILTEQMERDLLEFIEVWYNRKRRHSALDYKTIQEFWKQKNNFKNVA
jgi:putative transposase